MPEATQTPASRRFLPPSSSSRLQHSSSARKTQFAFPSQSISTSPLARTPYAHQPRFKDDIETNPETSDSKSSPALQDRGYDQRRNFSKHDSIEDCEDGGEESVDEQLYLHSKVSHHGHERKDLDDPRHTSTSSPKADFSSPLPKRQKMSHAYVPELDVIDVSSSPSPGTIDFSEPEHYNTIEASGLTGEQIHDIDSIEMQDIDEPYLTKQKFKIRTAIGDESHTTESPRQAPRGAFKGLATGGTAWAETPLPATFSPSKRKGRYDYVHGGAAETVRNWILDIANDQSKDTGVAVQPVNVIPIFTDTSGRFEVARDREGQTWMLVQQEGQNAALSRSNGNPEAAERSVVVKGSKTAWEIEMPDSRSKGDKAKNLRVAVLWDLETRKALHK